MNLSKIKKQVQTSIDSYDLTCICAYMNKLPDYNKPYEILLSVEKNTANKKSIELTISDIYNYFNFLDIYTFKSSNITYMVDEIYESEIYPGTFNLHIIFNASLQNIGFLDAVYQVSSLAKDVKLPNGKSINSTFYNFITSMFSLNKLD
jgi:hypothetical protein